MKNIAIIHNLPPGGGLRMISEIVNKYQDDFKIDIYCISSIKPKKNRLVKTIWYKVTPWKGFIGLNFWTLFILPSLHKRIAKTIDWNKYDFVLTSHDYFSKSPYIHRYIKNKKIIYLCQESQREFYEDSKIHAPELKLKVANIFRYPIKIIDKINVKYATVILCNSKYSKRVLEKIYKKKCEVVYPGVDEKKFKYIKSKKKNIILSVGGINSVKNQEFLIDSLNPLLKQNKLVLVGNGNQKYINKIIEKANFLNSVKIIKDITDKELISLYQKAKVTCISARLEPFGLSSIESQACGTPVVSINEGGLPETIVDGKTGYISPIDKKIFLEKTIKAMTLSSANREFCVKNVKENWVWEKTLKPLDKYFIK